MDSLITVIVVTYNSSSFIIETLDSIYNQTWSKIELIVTDDCSNDNTVELCHNWMNIHKSRFVRIKLITSEKNTGVPGNANRGLYSAKGEWIKFLGADDSLKPTCLQDNMEWISEHPEIKVLFSRVEVYKDLFIKENLISIIPGHTIMSNGIMASDRDASSQYRMLLVCDRIHFSPSVVINRSTILSVGGYDEHFRTFEDYPMWLKLTGHGHKLYFMNKVTVNYRMHTRAINNTGKNELIKPNYFKSENFRRQYTYPYLPFLVRNDQRFCWVVSQLFRFSIFNKNTILNRWIKYFLMVLINPFRYLIWFQKHFSQHPLEEDYFL